MTGADWQRKQLLPGAIPVAERLPPEDEKVLGWVSDEAVSIYHCPVVVWWTGRHRQWWAGLPTSYIDLRRKRWEVTHWLPLAGAAAAEHRAAICDTAFERRFVAQEARWNENRCPRCQGAGRIGVMGCNACGGTGQTPRPDAGREGI